MGTQGKAKKSILDSLVGDESDNTSSSEDEGQHNITDKQAQQKDGKEKQDSEEGDDTDEARKKKARKAEISLADLQRAGYKSGPSVLLIKRPPAQEEPQNWAWSNGVEAKAQQGEETAQEREETRLAASVGVEQTAYEAQMARQQAEELRMARAAERQQQAADRKLSFNQKEKRKREEGKTSRGKSYVEEEKRLQRQFGVYSGFDT